MATVYLGLGSNLGNRTNNLEKALSAIQALSQARIRISSVYETPALLLPQASPSWNKPFLNICVEIKTSEEPHRLLEKLRQIERELGRAETKRWAPRAIDIDILFWEGLQFNDDQLTIPHPRILERAFVLDPLAELAPGLKPTEKSIIIRDAAREHPQHCPRLMGIINLTPDSFSDGGKHQQLENLSNTLDAWDEMNISTIDLGAESTRPGATPITADEEWTRLQGALDFMRKRYHSKAIKPLVSVDTRHPQTASRAIECGAEIINDVSGLSDPQMVDVLKSSSVQAILMHSISIPADPSLLIDENTSSIEQVRVWFDAKLENLYRKGISSDRIILDPGIGFGKNSIQSLELLQSFDWIQSYHLPVLIGHSRKSFCSPFCSDFTRSNPSHRDIETLGLSMALTIKGVDILRVHDPIIHHRALLAGRHIYS